MKERIEGWLGGTYKIFQKPKGLFKLFQKFKPTDEAYARAINLFRRYLSQTDTTRKTPVKLEKDLSTKQMVPVGTEYYEQAKFLVDDIINQAQVKKKAGGLPDVTYTNATAMSKTKTFEGIPGRGSKVFRQLFGEIEDPR